MILSVNQATKLCELIGGMVKVPADHSYTSPRCVVSETDVHHSNEHIQPYLFHNINDILSHTRHKIMAQERIDEIKTEQAEQLVKHNDELDRIETELTHVGDEIEHDTNFKIQFGDDEQTKKAQQIREIIDNYT